MCWQYSDWPLRIALFSALSGLAAPAAAAAAEPAAVAIVLAIDVSASVDADSFVLQRDGIAQAFESPRLVAAITALPGGIEALFLEWSDPDQIAVAADWRRIADATSAAVFAAAVHGSPRRSSGRTAIGPALAAAAGQFGRLPAPARRRVIDVSGNGIANLGAPPAAARDRIVASGVTINGLAIPTGEPWLAAYYRDNVVGGPGAFVIEAQNKASFTTAMLRKLVQEVAGGGGPRQGRITAPMRRTAAISAASSGICSSGLYIVNLRGPRPSPAMIAASAEPSCRTR
jgi:hypothetical protein